MSFEIMRINFSPFITWLYIAIAAVSGVSKSAGRKSCRTYRNIREQTDDDLILLMREKGAQYIPHIMAMGEESSTRQFTNLIPTVTHYRVPLHKVHIFDSVLTRKSTRLRTYGLDSAKNNSNSVIKQIYLNKKDRQKRTINAKSLRHRKYRRDFVHPKTVGINGTVWIGADGSRTKIEYCQRRGSKNHDGYMNMCNWCAATTTLPSNRIPRVINEVICNPGYTGCFVGPDYTEHGICRQKYMNLKMVRKRTVQDSSCRFSDKYGKSVVMVLDDWELYQQTIRTGCECAFDSRSKFASFIKP
ncbi:uncharacterized protein LOC141898986 [Tubulanus polymorphus]|uniref:uncharacterized protein LOC141898986 n=1 Tax=Tubulanus polymorphus TaxID=672921 RepID=UPI003DA5E884